MKLNGAKSYTECSLGDLFGSWSKTLTVEKNVRRSSLRTMRMPSSCKAMLLNPVQVVAYVRYSDGTLWRTSR